MRVIGRLIGTVVLIGIVTPPAIIAFVIAFILLLVARNQAKYCTQKLEWLESEHRGPINTKFSSLIDGLITVRAYKKEDFFVKNYFAESDKVSCVAMTYYGVIVWFESVLDYVGLLALIIIVIVVYFIAGFTDYLGDVYLSVAIVVSYNLMSSLSFLGTTWLIIENQMRLVKNAMSYAEMPEEGDLSYENDPKNWPSNGEIIYDNVTMRYTDNSTPALDKLCFKINDQQKVGIQGRTGSGKSSLVNVLFRMYPIEDGTISINNTDISQIGLH